MVKVTRQGASGIPRAVLWGRFHFISVLRSIDLGEELSQSKNRSSLGKQLLEERKKKKKEKTAHGPKLLSGEGALENLKNLCVLSVWLLSHLAPGLVLVSDEKSEKVETLCW